MLLLLGLGRAAALVALAGLAACSGKNEETMPANDLRWTVDGTELVAVGPQAKLSAPNVVIDGTTGTATTGSFVRLTLPQRVGTSAITGPVTDVFYASNSASGNILYFAQSGTITVSHLSSTHIEGTFTFTGAQVIVNTATKTLTNGTFNLALK